MCASQKAFDAICGPNWDPSAFLATLSADQRNRLNKFAESLDIVANTSVEVTKTMADAFGEVNCFMGDEGKYREAFSWAAHAYVTLGYKMDALGKVKVGVQEKRVGPMARALSMIAHVEVDPATSGRKLFAIFEVV